MPALERLTGTRITATPGALDQAFWPDGAIVFRFAPDEVFTTAIVDASAISDSHAIVERESGFSGVWLDRAAAMDFLERECDWEPPASRPSFAQGLVAGLPLKVWFDHDRVLLIVASAFANDLMERLR